MIKIKGIIKQILINIVLGVIIVPALFFILLSMDFGYPNVRLHYGKLETRELNNGYLFETDGSFEPFKNTIAININNSREEAIRILYHEYGHYVYWHMDKKDKKTWETTFCKGKSRIGYFRFQICSEEFSDGFADYLMHRMDTIKEWEYFENITIKYLG